ncbi:MAG: hypothetical protein IT518_14730 [Burkholderiales bacterium]|nr:hypothetical protein [Burkholderiales bacterium]
MNKRTKRAAAMAADQIPAPGVTPGDEGEPQTVFLAPAEGGSYRRNQDGSLTRLAGPTITGTLPSEPSEQE